MNESDPPIDAEFETVSPDQSLLGLPFRAVWLVFVIISMVALALLATAFFGLKELNTPPALSADSQDAPTTAAEPPLSDPCSAWHARNVCQRRGREARCLRSLLCDSP